MPINKKADHLEWSGHWILPSSNAGLANSYHSNPPIFAHKHNTNHKTAVQTADINNIWGSYNVE